VVLRSPEDILGEIERLDKESKMVLERIEKAI